MDDRRPQGGEVVVKVEACGIFFFQAEDGIRDLYVTGVQTCALPIWSRPIPLTTARPRTSARSLAPGRATVSPSITVERTSGARSIRTEPSRSEERRVGKECRVRG